MKHLAWISLLSYAAGIIVSILALRIASISDDTQAIICVIMLFATALYLKEPSDDQAR